LGICERRITAQIPTLSLHRRKIRGASASPETLGEHLRLKRIDSGLTLVQVAQLLGLNWHTLQRCEHSSNRLKLKTRQKIVAFLGFDPEA
jgi:DNA-binding XRE family transcriptional regulator